MTRSLIWSVSSIEDDGIQNAWEKNVLMTTAMTSAARISSGSSSQKGSACLAFPSVLSVSTGWCAAGSRSGPVTTSTLQATFAKRILRRPTEVLVPQHPGCLLYTSDAADE